MKHVLVKILSIILLLLLLAGCKNQSQTVPSNPRPDKDTPITETNSSQTNSEMQNDDNKPLTTVTHVTRPVTRIHHWGNSYIDCDYSYDEYGRLQKEQFLDDGEKSNKLEYTYDENGNMIRTDHFNKNGVLEEFDVYTYDQAGRLSKMTTMQTNGKTTYEETYRYVSADEIIENQHGFIVGNISLEEMQLQINYLQNHLSYEYIEWPVILTDIRYTEVWGSNIAGERYSKIECFNDTGLLFLSFTYTDERGATRPCIYQYDIKKMLQTEYMIEDIRYTIEKTERQYLDASFQNVLFSEQYHCSLNDEWEEFYAEPLDDKDPQTLDLLASGVLWFRSIRHIDNIGSLGYYEYQHLQFEVKKTPEQMEQEDVKSAVGQWFVGISYSGNDDTMFISSNMDEPHDEMYLTTLHGNGLATVKAYDNEGGEWTYGAIYTIVENKEDISGEILDVGFHANLYYDEETDSLYMEGYYDDETEEFVAIALSRVGEVFDI